jgi:hypothetical protein
MDTLSQQMESDGSGSPNLDDIGACFSIPTRGALSLSIVAPPIGSSVRMRLGHDFVRAAFER